MLNFAAIRSAVLEKMTFEVPIFGIFPDIPEQKLSLPSCVIEGGCDVAKLYVLQSYRSCTFCKRKTRGETQFWIELAAPYTLANNNEMNSDDRLIAIYHLLNTHLLRWLESPLASTLVAIAMFPMTS